MRLIDADAIRSLVSIGEVIDAVEGAFRDVADGRDRSPLRSRVELPAGDLLLMPGVRSASGGASVKLVTVVPSNAARGLPTIHAIVVWLDGETGAPLALLDGELLTAMRTGAASGVATRLLARPEARALAMLGAGAQAAWQVRAVCAVRPIGEVRVYAPSVAGARALAERLDAELPARVRAVGTAEEAVRGADVVCAATTSSVPVLDAAWVAAGAHVNGIGSFRPSMAELPPALFGRAALVAVDARRAALAEAGDILAAIEAGELTEERLVEIGSLRSGGGRDPRAITVFKSVGMAAQDAAAAELIVSRALARG